MNKRIKKKQIKKKNKKLCKRYPFLIPRNRWTGKITWEKRKNKHIGWWYSAPYSYTELDAMPDGWRAVFGEQLCEELREELIKANYLDKYRITQIKEKYGSLRWYDNGNTEKGYEIIRKYEKLSYKTCINCGRPATKISTGWISPYCDKCAEKLSKGDYPWEFTDLEEENGR